MFSLDLKNSSSSKIFAIIQLIAALLLPGFSRFIFLGLGGQGLSFQMVLMVSIFCSFPLFMISMVCRVADQLLVEKKTESEINYDLVINDASTSSLFSAFAYFAIMSFFPRINTALTNFGYFKSFYLIVGGLAFLGLLIQITKNYVEERRATVRITKESNSEVL